jgi:hypothetical protein
MIEPVALDYRAAMIVGANGGSLIACAEGGGPNRAVTAVEARANAHLIAAAPDLLEALRQIRDGLANTGSHRGQWMTAIKKSDAWKLAADAIAKAEYSA